jgi:hypothetical protein
MKSIYSPEQALMKMSPDPESCSSRPYPPQNYVHRPFSLSIFTFSFKKINEKLKKLSKKLK